MPIKIVDPNDYTDCCNGLGGEGCGHEGLLRMPHLHADNCPLVLAAQNGGELPLFREDPDERKSFDRSTAILGAGDPLVSVCGSLDTWGRMHVNKNGYTGSYSLSCFIMANECVKAARRIKELEAQLQETT